MVKVVYITDPNYKMGKEIFYDSLFNKLDTSELNKKQSIGLFFVLELVTTKNEIFRDITVSLKSVRSSMGIKEKRFPNEEFFFLADLWFTNALLTNKEHSILADSVSKKLFTKVEIVGDILSLRVNINVFKLIKNCGGKFTKINMFYVHKINSLPSLRLYKILAQFRSSGKVEMRYETICNYLMIKNNHSQARSKIIAPSLELLEKRDLFQYEPRIKYKGKSQHETQRVEINFKLKDTNGGN